MWGYYGSKSKIVNAYPAPTHDAIIEPFAGTAQYSLKYFEREIFLIEKYELIVNLWLWLQKCSSKDILETRQLKHGESTDSFKWDCQERKNLVGFIISGAPTIPKKTATKWKTILRPNTQKHRLETIAKNLYKIRHWKIMHGDYKEAPEKKATWFIDPPYIKKGHYYKYGSKQINYASLAIWCKTRPGQVIVCESDNANWLPFQDLTRARGNKYQHLEKIWTRREEKQAIFAW